MNVFERPVPTAVTEGRMRMLMQRFDREVEILTVEGIDVLDYPDMVDARCTEAIWKDTCSHLSEAELEVFNDMCADRVQDWARTEVVS